MPSPTEAPVSLPERLADAEGAREPDDVGIAQTIANMLGYEWDELPEAPDGTDADPLSRRELISVAMAVWSKHIKAPILAAEAQRDAAIRERDDWKALAECRRITAGAEADRCEELSASLAAALARAERAEKALDFYRSAAVTSATMEGLNYRGVSNSMFRHAWEADRAALAHPATAEKT